MSILVVKWWYGLHFEINGPRNTVEEDAVDFARLQVDSHGQPHKTIVELLAMDVVIVRLIMQHNKEVGLLLVYDALLEHLDKLESQIHCAAERLEVEVVLLHEQPQMVLQADSQAVLVFKLLTFTGSFQLDPEVLNVVRLHGFVAEHVVGDHRAMLHLKLLFFAQV